MGGKKRLSSFQTIILGFIAVILVGTLLLLLPVSQQKGAEVSCLDALFTATSATCVTGLIVENTATCWSVFGQAVLLILIQIGGLGVVTMTASVALLSGRKIGLMQRSTMQEALSVSKMSGIVRLTGFILKMTFIIELIGACVMAPVFCGQFGIGRGIWYAIFHSVSAFCNAGFDILGTDVPYSSLTGFTVQPVINIAIMLLIVIGGIGFLTWDDIRTNHIHIKRYRMQSKVILTVSGILILLPAIYFFFCEFADMPMGARVYSSVFQSVTTRTAGFNTVDLGLLSEPGIMVMILLMLVGGSPGSTAGGLKTTTLAVLFGSAFSVFTRREHTHFFGRRIGDDVVKRAATIFFMYIFLFVSGAIVISLAEGLPFMVCLFETASAVGTVGLTLGITPGLGILSKLILIVLMFFGRVGGLTLIFATIEGAKKTASKLPQESLTIG